MAFPDSEQFWQEPYATRRRDVLADHDMIGEIEKKGIPSRFKSASDGGGTYTTS
jgi:hypothetical protein